MDYIVSYRIALLKRDYVSKTNRKTYNHIIIFMYDLFQTNFVIKNESKQTYYIIFYYLHAVCFSL